MIIFLYGQDSYRINQKLNELVNGYSAKNPSGLNFISIDLSESSLKDFCSGLASNSLIPEKRLIILKNIPENNSDEFIMILKSQKISIRDDIILIIIYFNDKNDKKILNYLTKKPNQSQNFELLKEYDIKNWAKKFFNSFNIEITGEALDFLAANCGNNLWKLDCEIRKISSFKKSGLIGKAQIEELVIANKYYRIFELTDALINKNKIKALKALYGVFENKEKSTELLGMLAWQIRNIIQFKLEPESLKIHPFVLAKIKESARFFSTNELKIILSKIINLDLAFKVKDMNEKTALSLLLAEL